MEKEAKQQSERITQQSADLAEIKVKLIENAVIVKAGPDGWFSFSTDQGVMAGWEKASHHIGQRLVSLKHKRDTGA